MSHVKNGRAVDSPAAQGGAETASREVLDAIPHGVLVARPDGTVELRNRHLLEYTGATSASAPGGSLDELHPDDRAQAAADWARARAAGQPGSTAGRARRHDGAYRWFRISFAPTRDAAGEVARWVLTWTDVDERADAEARHDTDAIYEPL